MNAAIGNGGQRYWIFLANDSKKFAHPTSLAVVTAETSLAVVTAETWSNDHNYVEVTSRVNLSDEKPIILGR